MSDRLCVKVEIVTRGNITSTHDLSYIASILFTRAKKEATVEIYPNLVFTLHSYYEQRVTHPKEFPYRTLSL